MNFSPKPINSIISRLKCCSNLWAYDLRPEQEWWKGDKTTPEVGRTYERCQPCDGRGRDECFFCNGSGNNEEGGQCFQCGGRGYKECFSCRGVGMRRYFKLCSKRSDAKRVKLLLLLKCERLNKNLLPAILTAIVFVTNTQEYLISKTHL